MNHYGSSSRRPAPERAGKARRGITQRAGERLSPAHIAQRRIPLTVAILLAISGTFGCQDAARPISPDQPLAHAVASLGTDKTAVCHAAGRADNVKFTELTLSSAAVSAHLDERGRARAGHEGDYLVTARTPCPPPPLTAPNVRICKAVDAQISPMQLFDFDVNGETIAIRGSTCVDRTFRVGTPVTISETVAEGTFLHSISITPQTAGTGDVAGATAAIIAGDDRADVTFSNRARLAPLTICKDVEPVGLLGKQFEFEASAPGHVTYKQVSGGFCLMVDAYPVGTTVSVVEMVGSGTNDVGIITKSITVDPADRLVPGSLNLATRRVSVTIGEGRTFVRYLNARPVGSLEICTVTPVGFNGAPEFFVNAAWADGLLARLTVPANQCVAVHPLGFGFPVGFDVMIGELVPAGLRLDAVTVDPPDHLIETTANTASVLIGAGTTRVTFRHVFVTP